MTFFGFGGFGLGKKKAPPIYLLMDREAHLLAKGELQGEPSRHNIQLKILEGLTDDVVAAEIVQAVPSDTKEAVVLGQVILRRGNLVVLEPLRELGSEVRRNFRMPVSFDSFLYRPGLGGRWLIRSIDLSCGGIAFFSAGPFQTGELYEVVIPITSGSPLIVPCRILRAQDHSGPVRRFAGKFDGIIDDEETLIREAVFSVQLESVRIAKQKPRARK